MHHARQDVGINVLNNEDVVLFHVSSWLEQYKCVFEKPSHAQRKHTT